MGIKQFYYKLIINSAVLLLLFSNLLGQQNAENITSSEILLGDYWDPETRELSTVFDNQSLLDLVGKGSKRVQLLVEIRNGTGRLLTWVFEYPNGIRQEVFAQRIRYGRFRTYLEKTFHKKLWDPSRKQLISNTGLCKILLIDKEDNNNIVATKQIELK